ncbi:MAG: CesT family type III secretion system chaperone [Planctomycetota bacterium]
MNVAQETLIEFARHLGLGDLRMSDEGVASLSFEDMGNLFVECAEEGVLVYLARTDVRLEPTLCRAALEICHWRHNHPMDINAAANGENQLVLSTRMSEAEFSLPRLEQALRLLDGLHDQIQEAVR